MTLEVVLERSGGFAGARRTVRLAGAALGPGEEARLRAAAARARFFELPAELRAAPAGPDRFGYRLEIEDRGRRHAVAFDEEAAGEELRALVDEVEEVAEGPGSGEG